MAHRKSNSGMGPGMQSKTISNVPLTKSEWARFARAREKYDATAGWIAGSAIRAWMNKRAL